MKKAFWAVSIAVGLLLGSFFIAQGINCPTSYPASLSNWTSGCVIPSSWANSLETTIGTTTLSTSLEQQVATLASNASSSLTGTPYYLPYWNASGLNATSSIYISSSTGDVGIGITNPSYTVDVGSGNTVNAGTLRFSARLVMTGLGGAQVGNLSSSDMLYFSNGGLEFATGGSATSDTAIYINSSGDVAINSTSTNGLLYVNGTSTLRGINNPNVTSSLNLSDSNGNLTAYHGSSCAAGNLVKSVSANGTVSCSPSPVQRWMKPYQWTEAAYNATTSATSTVYLLETPVPFQCTASAITVTAGSTTDSTDPVLVGIYGPVSTDTAASASLIVSATSTFSVSNAGVTIPFPSASVLSPGTYYLGVQFSSSSINYVAQQDQSQVSGWSQTYTGTSPTTLPSTIGAPTSNGTFIPNMELQCSSN